MGWGIWGPLRCFTSQWVRDLGRRPCLSNLAAIQQQGARTSFQCCPYIQRLRPRPGGAMLGGGSEAGESGALSQRAFLIWLALALPHTGHEDFPHCSSFILCLSHLLLFFGRFESVPPFSEFLLAQFYLLMFFVWIGRWFCCCCLCLRESQLALAVLEPCRAGWTLTHSNLFASIP